MICQFGNKNLQGTKKIDIRISITDKNFICGNPEVVEADIPSLLGLDVLTHLKTLVDFNKKPCHPSKETCPFPSSINLDIFA